MASSNEHVIFVYIFVGNVNISEASEGTLLNAEITNKLHYKVNGYSGVSICEFLKLIRQNPYLLTQKVKILLNVRQFCPIRVVLIGRGDRLEGGSDGALGGQMGRVR
jgi:hypothetical protein